MKENIAKKIGELVTDKKELLNGFKVLGIFPFYLKYIKFSTHVKLMVLKEDLQKINGNTPVDLNAFHNASLLQEVKPIIESFIITALINDRLLGFLFWPFIRYKIRQCGHRDIHNLYTKIVELSDPAFFLDYWTHLMKKNHVLLKMENPSSGQSHNIKKSSEVQKKK